VNDGYKKLTWKITCHRDFASKKKKPIRNIQTGSRADPRYPFA